MNRFMRSWITTAVAACLLHGPATAAEIARPHVFRFADRTVDIDDDASVASAFALDANSRLVSHIKPLLAAVTVNRAAKPSLADAINPAHRYPFNTALHWLDSVASAVFVHGLRRGPTTKRCCPRVR